MEHAAKTSVLNCASVVHADAARDERGPIHLGRYRQLFVDDHVIEQMHGVRRVVNRSTKHPANPLIKKDRPWEGDFMVGAWASTVYDQADGLFKTWYWAQPRREIRGMTCYATSKD